MKDIVNSYEEHKGAIFSLNFIDNNNKFISASDDRKLYVWEYGITVPFRYSSEPNGQTITATSIHPSGKYIAAQTLDNRISIFEKDNSYKGCKKKFTGHMSAGYSCGIDFSPDGQYLVSCDSTGGLYFYDWKSTKCYRVLNSHTKVTTSVKWHPLLTSKVISSSWDNTIKLWD